MPASVKLTAPPGYGAIVPLEPLRHAGLGTRAAQDFSWCAQVNAVHLGADEIPRAALDYPLAFARDTGSGEFSPVALFALQQKQNLFVEPDGRWRTHTYIPAYVRRYPFCIVHLVSGDGTAARNLVCVQEDRLEPSAKPMFDAQGNPTEAWQAVLQQLEAIEGARQRTRAFVRRLDSLGLLIPFDAVAVVTGGNVKSRLQGLFRIDEQKLMDIGGRDLRTMLRRGELRWAHSHLNSLDNFGRLFDMALARKDGH